MRHVNLYIAENFSIVMLKKAIFAIIIIALLMQGCAKRPTVTIVPRSAEELMKLTILEPKNGEILPSDSVRIIFEPQNFKIGDSAVLYVVLDNGPRIVQHTNEPLVLSSLSEGRHILRAFPAKRWGESIKDPESLVTVQFYTKKKNSELLNTNLPMLTYNGPTGYYRGEKSKRILLDFIVSNAILSKDGYRVSYKIDDKQTILETQSPIYLTDLQPGPHTILLELQDKNGNIAEGNFAVTQREFFIEAKK